MSARAVTVFLFTTMFIAGCNGQNSCDLISLGDLIKEFGKMDFSHNESLVKKRFSKFDFQSFKPSGVASDSLDYYEIGFDFNKQIRTITKRNLNSALNFQLVVFQFQDHRVLIVKKEKDGKELFTSLSIIMFHDGPSSEIFLVNFSPVFGENHGLYHFENYESFPAVKLEGISAIMELDKDLYPQKHVRLSNGYVALAGTLLYEADNQTIKYDLVSLIFERTLHPESKISEETCIRKVFDVIDSGDFVVPLHPKLYNLDKHPIWIFGGAHQYRE